MKKLRKIQWRFVKKLICFLLFSGLTAGSITAQQPTDPSHWLVKAAQAQARQQIDSALWYAEQALLDCEKMQDTTCVAESRLLLGNIWKHHGQVEKALREYLLAMNTWENSRNSIRINELHFELADLYETWQIYEKAFRHYQEISRSDMAQSGHELYLRALKGMAKNKYDARQVDEALQYYFQIYAIHDSLQQEAGRIESLRQIIKVYKEEKDFGEALVYNQQLLDINIRQQDTAQIIVSLNNIGVLYRQSGDLPKALNAFQQAFELEEIFRPEGGGNPITLMNIGILSQNLGDYQNSLTHLLNAEHKLKRSATPDFNLLANVNNLIAIIYLNINDINNAYFYNQQAITIAANIGERNLQQLCYRTRASIYEQVNDFKDALGYYQKHAMLKDTLMEQALREQEQQMKRQFSVEQTEKEINLLLIDREIQRLKFRQDSLENERLRQEKALQSSQLEREKLEKERAEQALSLAQQQYETESTSQALLLAKRQLEAEQKDRQITQLEKEQSQQALELAEERLKLEIKDREIALSAKDQAQQDLKFQQKEFDFQNRQARLFRRFSLGGLLLFLVIVVLLYRVIRIRRKANTKLSAQKKELEDLLADLKKTQAQLVQSEKMASLGQLTAGIAHEINNPLNFVSTNARALKMDLEEVNELLEEVHTLQQDGSSRQVGRVVEKIRDMDTEFLKKEMNELIASIERGTTRTQHIVSGLRIFSRNTEGPFQGADLHEGLDSTLTILNSKLKNRIEVLKDYGQLPLVNCQLDKLNQVFMNILSNAIEAIEGEGKIIIQTRPKGKGVEIRIKDSGTGIPESIRKRIFEPFFTTKAIGQGTGLGLSISYGIIEQHDGCIKVESEEGKGTEFIINLPVAIGDEVC